MDNNLTNEDHYTRIYRKTIENFICLSAHWELTYKCNLKCRQCYVAENSRKSEFSFPIARSVIDQLKAMGCLYLTFSGGEMLLRADFFQIAGYARKQAFALRLMTNGTLIDEGVSEKIASLNPLNVDMSVYSADSLRHDAITGVSGSFDRTINAAKLLKRKNLRVILKFLIMKDNFSELPAVKDLAKSIGADYLFDFCLIRKDNADTSPLKYRLDKKELKEFFLINNFPLSPLREAEVEGENLICAAGLNNIFITPYLDVYPCIGIKIKLGSLYQQELKEIWADSQELNHIRGIRSSDLKQCQGCKLMNFCGRCFGIALDENGDLLGRSEFDCLTAEAISEVLNERKELVPNG